MARPVKKRRLRREKGKPWYRKARDHWCITLNRKKVALRDKHENFVCGKDNEAEALRVWHEMLAVADASRKGDENELKYVLDLYLKDMKAREPKVSRKTFEAYKGYFLDFLRRWPGILIRELRPFHVQQWWASHPTWGPSTKNLTGTALKAALNWAAKPGKGALIPANPLDGMPLPTMRKRAAEVVVEKDEFARVMALVRSLEVRDVLTVLWETGTRPINLARATAQNLTEDGNTLVFGDHNTDPDAVAHKTAKKTGRSLPVQLPNKAREICVRLRLKRPEGPLFLTPTGLPWTATRLASTVLYYAKRAGLEGRFMAYAARHTRTTQLLEAQLSDTDVAAIMGNTPAVILKGLP
jgi:integrase